MGSFKIKVWSDKTIIISPLQDTSPLNVPHTIRPPVPKKGEDGVLAEGHTTVRCTQPTSFTSSHHRPRRGPPKPPSCLLHPHPSHPHHPYLKASSPSRDTYPTSARFGCCGSSVSFGSRRFLIPTPHPPWPTRVELVRPKRRLRCTRIVYIIRQILQWVDQFKVRDLECVPFTDFGADRLFRSCTKHRHSYNDERYVQAYTNFHVTPRHTWSELPHGSRPPFI